MLHPLFSLPPLPSSPVFFSLPPIPSSPASLPLPPLSLHSIIGLYVSVLGSVSSQSVLTDLPQNLLVDAILDPDYLLNLYDDIILVREAKELVMEEVLVGKLFYIFRSPKKLVELTEEEQE